MVSTQLLAVRQAGKSPGASLYTDIVMDHTIATTAGEMQGYRDTKMQGYRDTKMQGYRHTHTHTQNN